MNKILLSTLTAKMLTSMLYAGEDITAVEPIVKEATQVKETAFFKTVDGYVRAGYQTDGEDATDLALGGKFHVETNAWYGLSAGASFYTTHAIGSHDGAGFFFFDSNNESYDILGEAYLQAQYENTTFKAGRQEIDTPYADTDDIGMVPNAFEAYVLTNTDLSGTTLIAAYISKMAGVDAESPEKFTNIGMDQGMPAFGIVYEGFDNLALQGWYYDVRDSAGDRVFTYFDATYSGKVSDIGYEIAAQYSTQESFEGDVDGDANIYGIAGTLGFESIGISIGAAYNCTNGTAASDGFGGGPFYTSAENLTLPSGGADAKATFLTAEWDAGSISLDGLTLLAGYFTLTDRHDVESNELNLAASYAYNDDLSLDIIYYDTEDNINSEAYKSTRVFVNYMF